MAANDGRCFYGEVGCKALKECRELSEKYIELEKRIAAFENQLGSVDVPFIYANGQADESEKDRAVKSHSFMGKKADELSVGGSVKFTKEKEANNFGMHLFKRGFKWSKKHEGKLWIVTKKEKACDANK